jgi:hypothetical protein
VVGPRGSHASERRATFCDFLRLLLLVAVVGGWGDVGLDEVED